MNSRMPSSERPVLDRLETFAFFLDIDGTLSDIADSPDAAFVPLMTLQTVQRLTVALGGAVALVSGRQLSDIDRMFGTTEISAAGSHGAEIRCVGHDEDSDTLRPTNRAELEHRIGSRFAGAQGLLIECKPFSIAVHYRANPSMEEPVNDFIDALVREDQGMKKLQGKLVAEIVPADVNKGTAISAFMVRAPFAGRIPVFAGDDVTDEHGFEAVNSLGGISIRIGPGPSCAQYRFHDALSFRQWLGVLVSTPDAAT